MSYQLSVIRGDDFPAEIINITSSTDDFTGLGCTGALRMHPDGPLVYQFVPTVLYAGSGSGSISFTFPASATNSFPPLNLDGDIKFYAPGIGARTLFQFKLDVTANDTQL